MPKIIFIHGRGQQGRNPVELEQEWKAALVEGLDKIGARLPVGSKIVFAFYGDELQKRLLRPQTTMERLLERGEPSEEELYFLRDGLQELLDNAGVTGDQIRENYSDDLTEKGIQNWQWVIAMIRTADKVPGLRDLMLDLVTSDVYEYLALPHIRAAIDEIVASHIDSEPTIVVAHSLGTVVGYNVLNQLPAANITTFVTIGSPLGIRAVKKYLDKPLKTPPCISNLWFNALDKKDIVALNPLTSKHFPVTPEITNKTDLENPTSNRHGIEGYLSNPEVAGIIYQELWLSSLK